MEQIRQMHQSDIDASLALGQFAFQYEIAPAELPEARAHVRVENRYGFFVDGELAAQLTLLPLTVYVNGNAMAMGGIAGVASWPEHRRGGKVARLLRHSLELMRDRGTTVSMLIPFSFAFYRRYGWELCIERKQYTFETVDWSPLPEADGHVTRTTDWHTIAPVYEAFARRFTGTLQRSDDWWTDGIMKGKQGTIGVYHDAQGNSQGYVIYQVKNSELTVHELVYLTEDGRRGLWNFLRQHDSMAKKTTVVVPVTDDLPFLLSNPRGRQEIVPYFMARIVDVAAFLRQYRFDTAISGEKLRLRVTDEHAPWNQADFTIHVDRAGDVVVAAEPISDIAWDQFDVGISCDVQTLTAMMFGYMRPERLAAVGRLSGSAEDIARWASAIPCQTPFLYDMF